MTADREKAKEKVAKLMALAGDAGASAQEAETALRQAEKLMRKHAIDLAEVAARTGTAPLYTWAEDMVPAGWPKPIKGQPLWFGWIGSSIGKFTDTRVFWLVTREHGSCIKFQGDEVDVAYAVWLGNHIRNEIRIRANSYDAPGVNSDQRWANREEFRHQMANRICARMKALRAERDVALRTSSSTALVLVDDKIKQRDAAFGVQRYSNSKQTHLRGSIAAAIAGIEAGNKVSLHRPVEGTPEARKLT